MSCSDPRIRFQMRIQHQSWSPDSHRVTDRPPHGSFDCYNHLEWLECWIHSGNSHHIYVHLLKKHTLSIIFHQPFPAKKTPLIYHIGISRCVSVVEDSRNLLLGWYMVAFNMPPSDFPTATTFIIFFCSRIFLYNCSMMFETKDPYVMNRSGCCYCTLKSNQVSHWVLSSDPF